MLMPPSLRKVLNPETLTLIDHACDIDPDCVCGHKPVNTTSILNHINEKYDTDLLIEQMVNNLTLE